MFKSRYSGRLADQPTQPRFLNGWLPYCLTYILRTAVPSVSQTDLFFDTAELDHFETSGRAHTRISHEV